MQRLNERLSSIGRLSSHKNIDIFAGIGQLCLPVLVTIILSIFGYSTIAAQNPSKSENKDKPGKVEKVKLKEICITFDELPAAPGFGGVDIEAVSFLVLEGLKKHKVEAAGFVVGDQINGRHDILGQWLNDGHTLGSMTYSNQDYHELGIEMYLREVRMGHETLEEMLSGFGQKRRFFRFPFLHSGLTEKGRKQAYMFLGSLNVETVTATVLPEDYLYNLRLIKMGHKPDSVQFELLLNEYINHVLDEIERCERVAKQLVDLGFSILATKSTASFLEENAIPCTKVNKISEGRPHILDKVQDGKIQWIINTSSGNRTTEDSYSIRRSALDYHIPYTTTTTGAVAMTMAMTSLSKMPMEVKSLQEYL